MTKKNIDNTIEQHTNTSHTNDSKTLFGRKVAVHGLNDWHQVCLQWCRFQQQQLGHQANKKCSMYCFKHKKVKTNTEILSIKPDTTVETTEDNHTSAIKTLQDVIGDLEASTYNYSIVIVNGTELTIDNYIKATEQEHFTQEPRTRDRNVREINLGDRAETVLDNTKLMVRKTFDFSKSLLHTWCVNNKNKWISDFDYTGTFYTMKSRAIKMMDVARGRYDDYDDNMKGPTDHNTSPQSDDDNK
ncbi:hypothetical protein BC941DRAFT_471060 [Chlamydoabsidia padenii]|nr:hypothetical protein BC941DRAFT_471060 [Chlamydoabsidia padenii]